MAITSLSSDDPSYEPRTFHSKRSSKIAHRRNLAAFWIFGLCNNFAYVVMLSAAHDILHELEGAGRNETALITTPNQPSEISSQSISEKNSAYLECNTISTGAILLADILPSLLVKLTLPFVLQKIPYTVKISVVSAFTLSSFLLVAFAHQVWLSVIGVVYASIGAGVGEITFLSLTTFYHRNVVSFWSSGTGGAGVFGALAYAGLTSAGLSAHTSLITMVFVPVAMMLTYILVLTKPVVDEKKKDDDDPLEETRGKRVELTLRQKLLLVPPLFKYTIPLTLVYFAEYYINQGLHELLYFNGEFLSSKEQYRWYQVDYQIGVFISRSSVNFFQIHKLWTLPVLQLVNLGVLLANVFYRFIPSFWVVLAIVLWEGLLGGAAYVNTFYKITNEVAAEHKEFSIGIAANGDSVGIAVAGAAAIPSHNAICGLNIRM